MYITYVILNGYISEEQVCALLRYKMAVLIAVNSRNPQLPRLYRMSQTSWLSILINLATLVLGIEITHTWNYLIPWHSTHTRIRY